MKKKKESIGTFTIISKEPKGQKSNTIYTVTYQRSGKPEIYYAKMLWLDFRKDSPTWAFMDGREAQQLTSAERKEFVEEMPKFQKGGSYRKTHPITYTEKELLKQKIKEKESEIFTLQQQIDKLETEEAEMLVNKYKKYICGKKLEEFEEGLRELAEKTGYTLKKKNWAYNTDIVVYDIDNFIPVGIYKYSRGAHVIDELTDYDISQIIKENNDILDWLRE